MKRRIPGRVAWVLTIGFGLGPWASAAYGKGGRSMTQGEMIQRLIRELKPLEFGRGDRLPLYVWSVMGVGTTDDGETERIIRQLNDRGIAVVSSWNHKKRRESLAEGLRIGGIQKKLGLRVNVNANDLLHYFFDGSPQTAHLDEQGKPFFDESFVKGRKLGCPFRVQHRYATIKERVAYFVGRYQQAGIPLDLVFADWEVDGPIEWNDAWSASKRCQVCREHIPEIEKFEAFQKALRTIRCDMQKRCYADVVLGEYPQALVGNYAVYPHDGWRYWYDYFERFVAGQPHKVDQRARYRKWFHEFDLTGYTLAMPTVYPWQRIFDWYDFDNTDYRWFYNMLLVASNAARHTPPTVPIISFVHWGVVRHDQAKVTPFSRRGYEELLWHMLLRGHDGLFLWCPWADTLEEIGPVHRVYAAALRYKEFLDKGVPINFEVPARPGAVVSGLRWGERVLVRRTDFGHVPGAVTVMVNGKELAVPPADGRCQILTLSGQ